MPTLAILLLCLAAAAFYFGARASWLVYRAQAHSILANYWCRRTRQGVVVADQLSQLWPAGSILLDLPWRWDLSRYAVYPKLWAEMSRWTARELERSDLDLERYLAEAEDDLSVEKSDEPAAPTPTDPSRN